MPRLEPLRPRRRLTVLAFRGDEVRSPVLFEAVESGEQPRSTIKGRGAGHAAVLVDRDEMQPAHLGPAQQRCSLCFRAQHLLLRRDADVADRARTRTRSLALSSTHPPPTQPPQRGLVQPADRAAALLPARAAGSRCPMEQVQSLVSSPSPRHLRAPGAAGDSRVAGTAQNPCLGARSPTAAVGMGF